MPTIRDVAKQSGVSVATVSNVLHGRSGRVREETRRRVLAAMREVGYRPTAYESGTSGGFGVPSSPSLTRNIGVMVRELHASPIFQNSYFSRLFDGILEVAAGQGFSTTIFVERLYSEHKLTLRQTYDGRCDGMIVISPDVENEILTGLVERGAPLVSVGSTDWLPGVASVSVDNVALGERAVEHLLSLGHRRIAFLGPHDRYSVSERCAGYVRALRAAGNEYLLTYETRFENGSHRVLEAVDALLAIGSAGRPTALFCWNDGQAFAVMAALRERGVSVPEDMSLISVDDVPQAAFHSPPLTTFRQPLQQIGKTAAELLLRQIQSPASAAGRLDQPRPETHTLDAELIVRGSTSALPPAFR